MASRVLRLWNPDLAAWEPVGDPRLSGYLPLTLVDADLRYVNTAGDVVTGALTVQGEAYLATHRVFTRSDYGASLVVKSDAGTERVLDFWTGPGGVAGGLPRWRIEGASSTAETGSNAGSDFRLIRWADDGSNLGPALSLSRATGAATFGGAVTVPSLTVASLPVAVSPDASNALEWRANGFYSGGGGGGGLPTTGGTMTGPIASQGASVDSGGALVVTSPASAATDQRLFGASTPAYSPASSTLGASLELGIRFTPAAAQYLVAVRWYRVGSVNTPVSCRLWDTTSTGSPVWSTSSLAAWAVTGDGWKEERLPAGTQPLLVAGRTYVLSYTVGSGTAHSNLNSYTPTPDAGFTFNTHVNGSGGAYPTSTGSRAFSIDGAFRTSLAVNTPAQSGAIRLPNGTSGLIAWRNAADGGDLSLTMDSSDRLALAVGAGSLTTSATAGAASALPATPATYLTVVINSTSYKIPAFAV